MNDELYKINEYIIIMFEKNKYYFIQIKIIINLNLRCIFI